MYFLYVYFLQNFAPWVVVCNTKITNFPLFYWERNLLCEKLLIFYEKDLLCEKLLESLVFCGWLVKIAFFVGQISNLRIAFIL
jgi:hypothetical protein